MGRQVVSLVFSLCDGGELQCLDATSRRPTRRRRPSDRSKAQTGGPPSPAYIFSSVRLVLFTWSFFPTYYVSHLISPFREPSHIASLFSINLPFLLRSTSHNIFFILLLLFQPFILLLCNIVSVSTFFFQLSNRKEKRINFLLTVTVAFTS